VNIYRLQPPYFAKPKQHISTNHSSSFLFLNNIPKKKNKKEATISESEKEEISE
jgi:hypothetical protein